jgi:phenylacetate-CoA ligase
MGIGDITLSAWAEDEDGKGMHFMPRGFVHVELIDPATGEPKSLGRRRRGRARVHRTCSARPCRMLRFRSRDHVVVTMADNPTGRTGPRIRCVGRTDDMLIVRGVNLFPTAIRSLLDQFTPQVSGMLQVRPRSRVCCRRRRCRW